jgi:hypothetical protein
MWTELGRSLVRDLFVKFRSPVLGGLVHLPLVEFGRSLVHLLLVEFRSPGLGSLVHLPQVDIVCQRVTVYDVLLYTGGTRNLNMGDLWYLIVSS